MNPSTRSDVDELSGAFRSHRAELVRLAAFILGDRGAGEDIVQDVFVRVHRRPGALTDNTLPYLRRAVINGCRSALRRRRLIRHHAEKESPALPLTAEEAVLPSEERRQVLARALKEA